jgi:hypothetical protein
MGGTEENKKIHQETFMEILGGVSMRKKLFILLSVTLSFCLKAYAERDHYVIKVEGARIHVDYGTRKNIFEGDRVKVFMVDIKTHPKTGREIRSVAKIGDSVKVISSGRDVSVLLLSDERIKEGMPILLEKKITDDKKPALKSILLRAQYVFYEEDDYLTGMEAGYEG